MPNSPEQGQAYNDEIDLADLIRALWQGKWLVIGVTLATLALGIAYLMIAPKSYTASLEIFALPDAQAADYTELNNNGFLPVNKKLLLSKFIAELKSRQTIEATIASTDYLEQQADETDDEFGLRIRRATYGFELEAPSLATKNTLKTQWTLKILTGKPKLAKIIVADALELANQKISNELLKSFERLQNEHARTIKFGLEDLAFEYERAQAKYQSTLDNQLALLKEQASLARALDIKKRSLFTETYSSTTETNSSVGASSLSTVNTDAPTYLRGYLALEKEFDTLGTRKNPENFIPGLVEIENARLILLQDTKIKRARYLMALTPIGSDAFTAVTYDIVSLNFTSNQKTSLVLALSLVLGGMLGVFLLMIRNVLINKV